MRVQTNRQMSFLFALKLFDKRPRALKKEQYWIDMATCPALPLNTGAPGHLADNILGISGVIY